MKYIQLLVICALLFPSCKTRYLMGKEAEPSPTSFVKTKPGEYVEVKKLKTKSRKIIADGKEYKKSDVIEFSNGKGLYHNVQDRRNTFAEKRWEGKINIYTTVSQHMTTTYVGVSPTTPTGWQSGSHSHTTIYLQDGASPALLLMNYKNVKSLIPAKDPAYKYIIAYEKQKKKGKVLKYVGLGLFAAGIALLATDGTDGTNTAGGLALVSGIGVTIGGFGTKAAAAEKLRLAVAKYNGVSIDD